MILRFKLLTIIAVTLFLASCGDRREAELIPIKEVQFDVGFRPVYRGSGVCYDRGEELVYFTNVDMSKIKFFTPEGEFRHEVLLNIASQNGYRTERVVARCTDTILLVSDNGYDNNVLFFVNGKGECFKEIGLNSVVQNNKFNYTCSDITSFQSNSLLLYQSWIGWQEECPPVWDRVNFCRCYYKNRNEQPYLFRLNDIYQDSVTFEFGLNNFYARICKDGYISHIGMPFYSFQNDKIFVSSLYNDTLYVVNNNTFEIERCLHIESKYSSVGKAEQVYIDEKTADDNTLTNRVLRLYGSIYSVMYNRKKDVYLVTILHDMSEKYLDNPAGHRVYSLLIMDSDFNVLGEQRFEPNMRGIPIMLNDGLFLFTGRFEENEDMKKPKFVLYDIKI